MTSNPFRALHSVCMGWPGRIETSITNFAARLDVLLVKGLGRSHISGNLVQQGFGIDSQCELCHPQALRTPRPSKLVPIREDVFEVGQDEFGESHLLIRDSDHQKRGLRPLIGTRNTARHETITRARSLV